MSTSTIAVAKACFGQAVGQVLPAETGLVFVLFSSTFSCTASRGLLTHVLLSGLWSPGLEGRERCLL